MIWTIIGALILFVIASMAKKGKGIQREQKRQERERVRETRQFYKETQKDPDLYKKQWQTRVRELGLDLSKAERVKYYLTYYSDKSKVDYIHLYVWAEEGAICTFKDYRDYRFADRKRILSSPLEWNVQTIELVHIEGVYKRTGITILQWKDGTQFGYAEEDGDKLKEIVRKAREAS